MSNIQEHNDDQHPESHPISEPHCGFFTIFGVRPLGINIAAVIFSFITGIISQLDHPYKYEITLICLISTVVLYLYSWKLTATEQRSKDNENNLHIEYLKSQLLNLQQNIHEGNEIDKEALILAYVESAVSVFKQQGTLDHYMSALANVSDSDKAIIYERAYHQHKRKLPESNPYKT